MAINSINTVTAAAAASTQTTTKSAEKTSETTKKADSSKTASGVIYEKSSDSRTDKASNKTTSKTDNAAIVAKLKADAEQRTAQLRSIVEQMMTKQGVAIGTADDMWKFLAKGDFTVSADVKAQAQADIADDGYWGVEQTSDRILDFAKALSGSLSPHALVACSKPFLKASNIASALSGSSPDKAFAKSRKVSNRQPKHGEINFRIFPREPTTQLSRNSTNGKTEQRMLPLRHNS